MDTIFLVTRGCYSDYEVERVFSTMEKAEAWISDQPTKDEEEEDFFSYYKIETMSLDDVSNPPGTYIRVDLHPETSDLLHTSLSCYAEPPEDLGFHKKWAWGDEKNAQWYYSVYVKTHDKDRAVKVSAERWAVWKSMNAR